MNYTEWSDLPNNFFVKCTSGYDNERYLYDVLEMEGYNKFGVQMTYYPVNISADPLYQENNTKVITRKFDYMGYYELPNESRNISILGIVGTDNFKIFTNYIHFNFVSTFDSFETSGVYPSYLPKIGDLVFAKYNHQFYRINMVKKEDNIHLQGKHTYTFFVDNFRDQNYLVDGELKTLKNDVIFDIADLRI